MDLKWMFLGILLVFLGACDSDDNGTPTDESDGTETPEGQPDSEEQSDPEGESVPARPELNRYIVTSDQNRLMTIDANNGSQTEIAKFTDPFADINSMPYVENDIAYFITDRQTVNGVDIASRQRLWETPIIFTSGSIQEMPPTVCNEGICYATGEHGGLVAVDQTTGEEIWRYSIRPDGEFRNYQDMEGTPVFKDNNMYVISRGSDARNVPAVIHMLDKNTGRALMKLELPHTFARTPVVAGDVILVPSKNLYALDTETLQEKWVFETRLAGVPFVSGDKVVLQAARLDDDTKAELYALDFDTGEMLWKVDTGFDYLFNPIVAGNLVFGVEQDVAFVAFQPNGRPFAVTLSEGKEVWEDEDISVDTSPVFANGRLFFFGSKVGDDGLFCMDANTGEILWNSDGGLGTFSTPPVVVAENGVFGPSEYRGN